MAKSAIASFKYRGNLDDLYSAILESCGSMRLKVGEQLLRESSAFVQAKEPMKWLTTNWPISFDIAVTRKADHWAVLVTGTCGMYSITQDRNIQDKVNELSGLIRTLSPGASTV